MRTKRILILMVSVLATLSTARDAAACSCFGATLSQHYVRADFVFLGEVVRVDTTGQWELTATFRVDESWKGVESDTFSVSTSVDGASCGVHFESEERYLVFGYGANQDFPNPNTHLCSGTQSEEAAAHELGLLRRPSPPDDSVYFPLQSGNSWSYRMDPMNPDHQVTMAVSESVSLDDRAYSVVTHGGPLQLADTLFVDPFGNIGFRKEDRDALLFDFSLSEDGHYYVEVSLAEEARLRYTVTIRRNQSVQTPLGYFSNALQLYFQCPHMDCSWEYTFAHGVGLVQLSGGLGEWIQLESAYVGGETVTSTTPGPLRAERSITAEVFPNPFGAAAELVVHVAEQTSASISLYDALGRAVQTLFEGTLPTGRHVIRIDGGGLSPGRYQVRIDAGGEIVSRPVIRVR